MAITSKHVTDAALQAALQVVKGKMPKAGTGIQQNADGTWSVIPDEVALKTINGQSLKGDGDIVIDLSLYKVVDTLPTTGIDDNKIYLVRNTETVPDGELNVYVEYMHVGSAWEKVGEYKSAFDPTDLKALIKAAQDTADAAKTAADKAAADIAGLATKYPNLTADLDLKADKSYVDSTFVKATELEALCMTAADGTALANTIFG